MNASTMPRLPAAIGSPFEGGFLMGGIWVSGDPYALLVAPRAEGEFRDEKWHKKKKNVPDASSLVDGLSNTIGMTAEQAEAGSGLAKKIRALRIGGKDDWYLMSRLDGLTLQGALPLAGAAFAEDGAEAFDLSDWYWTSTQSASYPDVAWVQHFFSGVQDTRWKSHRHRARAVRRVPL